jgi:nitroimidazol reductase NimA-like FMN-containing flavoprotein (pyridoxamine 5'-phosphate oxidase superfamily)
MRRKEFYITDKEDIEGLLASSTYGVLGLIDDEGFPYTVPLNFVYHDGAVYCHGATTQNSKKIKSIKANNKASFTVVQEYSLLPSYFTGSELACPATQFFKSVFVRGNVELVSDTDEKIASLSALMQKLQPEGNHQPITAKNEEYAKELNATAVIKLIPNTLTAKFKFGQNQKPEAFEKLVAELNRRGDIIDKETVRMMKKYYPNEKIRS